MDRIIEDPAIFGGRPIFDGTRVQVTDVLEMLADGSSIRQVLRTFPLLEESDVRSALRHALLCAQSRTHSGPVLSFVVIVFDMPEQAKRTLLSLSPEYQQNVSAHDYEVVVVENSSERMLGESAALACSPNARYFCREETSKSPAGAVNFGASQALGSAVGIMIDGARMLTPGVVVNTLAAFRATPAAVVAVPGYHLGDELQQRSAGHDETVDDALLAQIAWPNEGYQLFDVACLSGSSKGGVFRPLAESNCLCMPRSTFDELGGCDVRFDLPAGGLVNLDLYKRACEFPGTTLFVLHGEGSFHQFHGGLTTGGISADERKQLIEQAKAQYEALRGQAWTAPTTIDPTFFGKVHPPALRFVHQSSAPRPEVPGGKSPRPTPNQVRSP